MSHSNQIIADDINKIIQSGDFWHSLFGKNILISGASGFIASYIVEVLLELNNHHNADITIYALARNKRKFNKRFQHHSDNTSLVHIHSDVVADIQQLIPKKLSYIIHAASNASPKYYGTDPIGTLEANTIGTSQLLNLSNDHKVESFLYVSSAEVYGTPGKTPTSETDFGYLDPMDVRSCYAESKRMGENMSISWHHQKSVPIKIARPFHTYGPGMDLNDGRVYADFINNVINEEPIVLNSAGTSQRAFCYLSDAVEALFYVLVKGQAGEAYNLGNDQGEISIINLAKKLQSMYPKQVSKVVINDKQKQGYIASKVDRICPNILKIKKLGWSPQTSIEEGFNKTIMSYKYET